MEGVFSQFRNAEVRIYGIKRASSYSSEAETEFLCSVSADVQPSEGGLSGEDYGLQVSRKLKMYCENRDEVSEGNYAEVDGEMYRIASVKRWSLGIEAELESE